MAANVINADLLAKMFLAGAKNLEAKKEWINELNVFPVPDGDTGTNMVMTIMSAAKDVRNLPEDVDMGTLCKNIYSGAMRGARGNSGVITSLLFRGISKGLVGRTAAKLEKTAEKLKKCPLLTFLMLENFTG